MACITQTIGAASTVWAWGDLGHRVICQIAFQELNDTARTEVMRLIALDATFDSFTDAEVPKVVGLKAKGTSP